MPLQEIDEAELVALRRNNTLLARALGDTKSREQVLTALKIANPDLPVPELDAKAPVIAEINGLKNELAEFRKSAEEERAARVAEKRQAELNAKWSAGQAKAKSQGYSGDGLSELEKFMEEKGIFDHDIAIPAFERLHPPATPVSPTGNRFDFFAKQPSENGDENMKRLWAGDDEGFLQGAISDTLKQARGL